MSPALAGPGTARAGARIRVEGAVQGTGFRPFVYRLATALGLGGSVRNTPSGVLVLVEGAPEAVETFCRRLAPEAPRAAVLGAVAVEPAPARGVARFTIEPSETAGDRSVALPPDLAPCPDCLRELNDPADRRHGYPFLNCTACGPRLSIVEGLPYDRPATVMRAFPLCPECAREYGDVADRRFHAQPVACPRCGPRLAYEGPDGSGPAPGEPLDAAAAALKAGWVLALKGLGGYQLLVDARDDAAVARLRARKGRESKPLAVMFPDLGALRRVARVDEGEAALLASPAAPIVLLSLADRGALSARVAPGLGTVGAMLPSTPLHHLLLARLGFPVVCTSGNVSEEPMAVAAEDARRRLGAIADAWLHHDRPIARPLDDSVARLVDGAPLVLRRARGFAPEPVALRRPLPTVRALGGHLKSAVAWSHGAQLIASQHVGDLDHPLSLEVLERTIRDYERLFRLTPVAVACDRHPDYATTRLAEASGLPVVRVQHHHAHVAAVLAEAGLEDEVLGVAWDGTGWGPDGTAWGGEFLAATATSFRRVARLLPFPLPGGGGAGQAGARQPWRAALGVLHALDGEGLWARRLPPVEHARRWRPALAPLLDGARTVRTSSAGRLFDAAASLLGLCQQAGYEAEAAMRLEQAAGREAAAPYPFALLEPRGDAATGETLVEVDWRPAMAALVADVEADAGRGAGAGRIASRFHRTLAAMIGAVGEWCGLRRVALAGGCFQNAVLVSLAAGELRRRGFEVHTARRIPPNDGGLAVGQAFVAAHRVLAGEA